ncbi:regenerating islet-derived protein 4-like isoform X2 [Paroedura picta]
MEFFSSRLALLVFVTMGRFQEGAAIPPPCHLGWEYSMGHCYKLFVDKAPWLEAEVTGVPWPLVDSGGSAMDHISTTCACREGEAAWVSPQTLECQDYSKSGHLVSILHLREVSVVEEVVKGQGHESCLWTGLFADNTKGLWQWTDHSKYNYAAWAAGEPKYQGKDKVFCVQLSLVNGPSEWVVADCDIPQAYVCKYAP